MRNIVQNHMNPCSGYDINMLTVVSDMLESIFTHMIGDDLVTKDTMTKWLSAHEVSFTRHLDTIGGITSTFNELESLPEDFDPVKALKVLQGMFVTLNTEEVPQRELLLQQMHNKRAELERVTGKAVNIEESGVLTLIDLSDEEDDK